MNRNPGDTCPITKCALNHENICCAAEYFKEPGECTIDSEEDLIQDEIDWDIELTPLRRKTKGEG